MKLIFKFHIVFFLYILPHFLKAQKVDINDQKSFICFSCNQLQVNPKLEKALKKLHNVRVNNLKLVQLDFPSQSDNLVSSNFSK